MVWHARARHCAGNLCRGPVQQAVSSGMSACLQQHFQQARRVTTVTRLMYNIRGVAPLVLGQSTLLRMLDCTSDRSTRIG